MAKHPLSFLRLVIVAISVQFTAHAIGVFGEALRPARECFPERCISKQISVVN